MNSNNRKINRLINMAWESDDENRARELARQVLAISPEYPEALLILADNTENDNDRSGILKRALKSLSEGNPPDDDERNMLKFSVYHRLAFTYFVTKKYDDALSCCEAAMKIAEENDDPDTIGDTDDIKALHYRILIELKEWQKVLALTMRDESHDLAWAYSRLIAAWMTAPGKNQAVCANMFWDALMLSPDVPFYMLGYYEAPNDDDDEDENEDFGFALMFYDAISASEKLDKWFTRGTILFGLLSNRFEEKEREYVTFVLDTLGGYAEYDRMSSILLEADDQSIIETLAANKCLAE